MKSLIVVAALFLAPAPALAEPSESAPSRLAQQTSSRDFFDAGGRLIGSMTMIGDVSYFTSPDGRVIGIATIVDGRRIYRSY
jgi:hypothetical protein